MWVSSGETSIGAKIFRADCLRMMFLLRSRWRWWAQMQANRIRILSSPSIFRSEPVSDRLLRPWGQNPYPIVFSDLQISATILHIHRAQISRFLRLEAVPCPEFILMIFIWCDELSFVTNIRIRLAQHCISACAIHTLHVTMTNEFVSAEWRSRAVSAPLSQAACSVHASGVQRALPLSKNGMSLLFSSPSFLWAAAHLSW